MQRAQFLVFTAVVFVSMLLFLGCDEAERGSRQKEPPRPAAVAEPAPESSPVDERAALVSEMISLAEEEAAMGVRLRDPDLDPALRKSIEAVMQKTASRRRSLVSSQRRSER